MLGVEPIWEEGREGRTAVRVAEGALRMKV